MPAGDPKRDPDHQVPPYSGTTSIPGLSREPTPSPGSGDQTASIAHPTPDSAQTPGHAVSPSGSGSLGSGARRRGGFRPTFDPGEVVARRYRVVRFIAQGGMGEVYEVEDQELHEHVALKTVRPEIAGQPGAIERFKREIHLSRKVTHPNVCRIFDVGHHQIPRDDPDDPGLDVTFLTMELLEGETLAERLKRLGRLRTEEALPIVRQMATALDTAHEAGIAHRDFKSSNVVLVASRKGPERAVVADFGLAHGAVGAADSMASLTGLGKIVGTPAYMAPEQVEGKHAGPAADLYALGVVMFEMVTGRWPFVGDSPLATAALRLKQKPASPRSLVPELDPRWDAAILRCLARDPEDRFESAGDVARALAGEEVRGGRRDRLWLRLGVAAAISVALAAGFALSRLGQRGGEIPSQAQGVKARRSVAVLGFKNLGRSESAWLSTALSEMLRTELGAGAKLRTIPGETVARTKLELSLADADSLARDTLAQVRANLGADLVVLGSFLSVGKEGKIRLDVRLQDTATGEVVASTAEQGTEEELFELVSRAGASLRGTLGLGSVAVQDEGGVKAALPATAEAQRLYAEGLARLRLFDALAARELLEQAVAADPQHPLARSALAAAWSALGYDEKARSEAARAFELGGSLAREERIAIEGRLRETGGEWDKAIELYRGLFVFFSDSLDYGLRLAAAQTQAGRGTDALATIEALRRLPAPAGSDPRVDLAEASAAKSLTDFARQQRAAAAAAEKARAQRATLLFAEARLSEATALVDLDRLEDARRAGKEARDIFAATGERAGAARADNAIGVAHAKEGDLAGARARFEAALATFREIGDQRGIAKQLNNVANVELPLGGKPARARALYEEAVRISREVGDKSGVARTLNNLGALAFDSRDFERARRTYEEALATWEQVGERRNVALVLDNLGEVLEAQGRPREARARYEQSLEITRALGLDGETALVLPKLARLLAAQGDAQGARRLLDEAAALEAKAGKG